MFSKIRDTFNYLKIILNIFSIDRKDNLLSLWLFMQLKLIYLRKSFSSDKVNEAFESTLLHLDNYLRADEIFDLLEPTEVKYKWVKNKDLVDCVNENGSSLTHSERLIMCEHFDKLQKFKNIELGQAIYSLLNLQPKMREEKLNFS